MGTVETLIVCSGKILKLIVTCLKNSTTTEITIAYFNKDQESDQSNFRDSATNAELEIEETMSLVEWFVNEYKKFGCTLEFVMNKSQEGWQFCKGLEGIGGILRYQLNIRSFDDDLSESDDDGESSESE